VQLDHPAAHPVDHLVVVSGDDHRRTRAVHAVQQLHDPDRCFRIQVAGGLVRQKQRRMVHECACQRHALLLTAGQLVGVAVELRRETDEPQDLRHLGLDSRPRLPDHLQGVRDVVVDGAVGQQLVVLEHHADVAAQLRDPLARKRRDVTAGDQHLPPGRVHLAQQELDEGRLSTAGLPDEEGELPAPDRRGGPVEADIAARIDDGHVAQLDRGRPHGAVQDRPAGIQGLVNGRHEQGILAGRG
jgi:hypothetical protein